MGDVVQMDKYRPMFGKKVFLYYVNTEGKGVVFDKESKETIDIILAEQLMLMNAKSQIRGSYDIEGIRQYEIDQGNLLPKDELRLTVGISE